MYEDGDNLSHLRSPGNHHTLDTTLEELLGAAKPVGTNLFSVTMVIYGDDFEFFLYGLVNGQG